MQNNPNDFTHRPREETWIRLSVGIFIALLSGILAAFILGIDKNLGGIASMLIVAALLLAWAIIGCRLPGNQRGCNG
jgi:Mg/Co/Ni transporter MgtE